MQAKVLQKNLNRIEAQKKISTCPSIPLHPIKMKDDDLKCTSVTVMSIQALVTSWFWTLLEQPAMNCIKLVWHQMKNNIRTIVNSGIEPRKNS
ncbi:hypothetical protein Y1Q_0016881 [Alligator mississippiensis]|uniref:Uncharacterized protein n=1 Tax=Alligator mississippiensis TaxID=8496 RepID=A0A151P7P5_ALLMI|nr:hypothetical protein Y1Q_0016881 [Alligator mississippiensis]